MAHRRADRIALQSRQQRPLTRYFPEIITALEQLDTAVVLDGELVLWREGRLDFPALQQRVHPADARARQLSLASAAAQPSARSYSRVAAAASCSARSRARSAARGPLHRLHRTVGPLSPPVVICLSSTDGSPDEYEETYHRARAGSHVTSRPRTRVRSLLAVVAVRRPQ
ncbi:ATP-dependent DNA ligase [Pseudonocardia parietis]|uniref:ATP-dependent DNA ligase n=1 Tax=Pseudonocardia parietis TaxID=570936 RepID=UPI003559084F